MNPAQAATNTIAIHHPQANRTLQLGDVPVAYCLQRSKRRSIGLLVGREGLIVRAPLRAAVAVVELAVQQKAGWIWRKFHAIQVQHEQPPAMPLVESLQSPYTPPQIHAHFVQRLNHFAPLVGVQWRKLTLSAARTRWGSARSDGSIRLHRDLIHVPLHLLDYVVVHELSHLREMNHSPRFWAVVQSVLPDYKNLRKELKNHLITT